MDPIMANMVVSEAVLLNECLQRNPAKRGKGKKMEMLAKEKSH